MSYKIQYSDIPVKTEHKQRKRPYLPAFAIIFACLALAARLLYPTQMNRLTDALFPLSSDSSKEALKTFSQHISEGEPFKDAVTAFCQEIIDEANSK